MESDIPVGQAHNEMTQSYRQELRMKRAAKKQAEPVEVPEDLEEALDSHLPSFEAFHKLPPSHQREYVQWIEEAKTEATRQKRIEKTLAKVLENK